MAIVYFFRYRVQNYTRVPQNKTEQKKKQFFLS